MTARTLARHGLNPKYILYVVPENTPLTLPAPMPWRVFFSFFVEPPTTLENPVKHHAVLLLKFLGLSPPPPSPQNNQRSRFHWPGLVDWVISGTAHWYGSLKKITSVVGEVHMRYYPVHGLGGWGEISNGPNLSELPPPPPPSAVSQRSQRLEVTIDFSNASTPCCRITSFSGVARF